MGTPECNDYSLIERSNHLFRRIHSQARFKANGFLEHKRKRTHATPKVLFVQLHSFPYHHTIFGSYPSTALDERGNLLGTQIVDVLCLHELGGRIIEQRGI